MTNADSRPAGFYRSGETIIYRDGRGTNWSRGEDGHLRGHYYLPLDAMRADDIPEDERAAWVAEVEQADAMARSLGIVFED